LKCRIKPFFIRSLRSPNISIRSNNHPKVSSGGGEESAGDETGTDANTGGSVYGGGGGDGEDYYENGEDEEYEEGKEKVFSAQEGFSTILDFFLKIIHSLSTHRKLH